MLFAHHACLQIDECACVCVCVSSFVFKYVCAGLCNWRTHTWRWRQCPCLCNQNIPLCMILFAQKTLWHHSRLRLSKIIHSNSTFEKYSHTIPSINDCVVLARDIVGSVLTSFCTHIFPMLLFAPDKSTHTHPLRSLTFGLRARKTLKHFRLHKFRRFIRRHTFDTSESMYVCAKKVLQNLRFISIA